MPQRKEAGGECQDWQVGREEAVLGHMPSFQTVTEQLVATGRTILNGMVSTDLIADYSDQLLNPKLIANPYKLQLNIVPARRNSEQEYRGDDRLLWKPGVALQVKMLLTGGIIQADHGYTHSNDLSFETYIRTWVALPEQHRLALSRQPGMHVWFADQGGGQIGTLIKLWGSNTEPVVSDTVNEAFEVVVPHVLEHDETRQPEVVRRRGNFTSAGHQSRIPQEVQEIINTGIPRRSNEQG